MRRVAELGEEFREIMNGVPESHTKESGLDLVCMKERSSEVFKLGRDMLRFLKVNVAVPAKEKSEQGYALWWQ